MLLLFAYHCHSLRPLCMWDTALSYSFMFCSCNVTVLSALSHVQNISLLCILSLAPSLYVGCCFMLYVILCFVLVMLLFFTPFPLLCRIFHYCMPSLAPSLWDVLLYVILCSFMFVCPPFPHVLVQNISLLHALPWDVTLCSFMFCSCNVTVLSALSHVQNISLLCILSLAQLSAWACSLMMIIVMRGGILLLWWVNQKWASSLMNIFDMMS